MDFILFYTCRNTGPFLCHLHFFSYSNVIDVGALDTHNLEQHEYMDRSRAYSKRIEAGRIKLPETVSCLLKDIPAPERILTADPLIAEDQELVNTCKDTFLHLLPLLLRQLDLRIIKVIHATNI